MVFINNTAEHLLAWQQQVHCPLYSGKQGKINSMLVVSQWIHSATVGLVTGNMQPIISTPAYTWEQVDELALHVHASAHQ